MLDALAFDDELWAEALRAGILYRVPGASPWFNFRQLHFTRRRSRCPGATKYGGMENLNTHGSAGKWKELLAGLVDHGVAVDIKVLGKPHAAKIVKTGSGIVYLRKLHVDSMVIDKYNGVATEE